MIGRQISFGSHSEDGADLQALLLSVFATLDQAGIHLWRWLEEFLGECAAVGPAAAVADPPAWMPWGMAPERRAVCEALDWRKPDGGLKEMSGRVLQTVHMAGLNAYTSVHDRLGRARATVASHPRTCARGCLGR